MHTSTFKCQNDNIAKKKKKEEGFTNTMATPRKSKSSTRRDERNKSRRVENVSIEVHPEGQMNVSHPKIENVHIHQHMRQFTIFSPHTGVMTRRQLIRRDLTANDDQSLQDAFRREHVMEMFSREELQRLVQEKDINVAAFNLSDETRIERLGRKLSLSSADVDRIKEDYKRSGLKEVVFQMLLKWKRKGGNVTIKDLVKVLCDSKMDECAIAIKSNN